MTDQDPERRPAAGDLSGELEAALPVEAAPASQAPEHVRFERGRMRASLQKRLFGEPFSEPVRLGRFVILGRLGQGGMGMVYSAYDPQLDRRVALKLLGAGREVPSAQERLLREAQALARLAHPHVIPIHDVGVLGEQIFVVMEEVAGTTLRAWARERPRSWREILAVYLQAGRGLGAAHAAGLVHRDFKPDKALVGADGRVRVVDFGLARGLGDAPDPRPASAVAPVGQVGATGQAEQAEVTRPDRPSAPAPEAIVRETAAAGDAPAAEAQARLGQPLTATGTVLGTPAYMSPEQMAGQRVDARSDQFSFCVSLYEALYGQRPFAGTTLEELREALRTGQLAEPPPGRVPRWLHPILRRGLRLDPAERYPSMDALLDALGRDPALVRRRALMALGFVGLASLSLYLLVRPAPLAADQCQGGAERLGAIWNPAHRAHVERALTGKGEAYSREVWPRVEAGLEAYARTWVELHRDACVQHRRGEQSSALLDRRMACLERRRQALTSVVAVLEEPGAQSLDRAIQLVHELPDLGHCGDAAALSASVPPPEDPALARRAHALDEELSRARALESAGRYGEALTRAASVVAQAETLGYPPLLAEALLIEGRVRVTTSKLAEAAAPLERAGLLALAAGADEIAVEALARNIYARGVGASANAQLLAEVLAQVPFGEALSARVVRPAQVRALLLNNTGAVHLARGERAEARAYFERALVARAAATGPLQLELLNIERNLALLTPDEAQRLALMARARAALERALGPAHPLTLDMRVGSGSYSTSPRRAQELLEPACAMYERYHPDLVEDLRACLEALAFVSGELGQKELAAQRHERLAALLGATGGALQERALGYAALYRGEHAAARAHFEPAYERFTQKAEGRWWIELRAAQAALGLGVSELALGQRVRALEHLERARAIFERVSQINQNPAQRRYLAWSEVALGTALWESGAQAAQERALALVGNAERWYAQAGEGYEPRLQELAAWRRARPGARVTD